MAVRINHDAELRGLQIVMRDVLASIDQALDRGDRRAFRLWCRKWASLSTRAGNVLADLADSES